MSYYISDIEYYLPEKLVPNSFFTEECGIDAGFLEDKVGIAERHFAGPNESTSDMSVKACKKLLKSTGINKNDIDLVLLCTQNPDYRIPTTACIVQHKLGIKHTAVTFDINLGCSGFTISLPIAGNFINAGSINTALLIMADQYSKILDMKDRNTAPLFGDAAAAILLKKCENGYGVLDSYYWTDGAGAENLILPNSGIVSEPGKPSYLYMNGREVLKFVMRVVPANINSLLEKNNLKKSQIDYYIFHQANEYMLEELRKRMELGNEQVIKDVKYIGNTVSATIPITIKNMIDKNMLRRGQIIVLCGFGVGLSVGTLLYKVP